MGRKILLACGVASSALYVVTDLLGAARWDGYSLAAQTISELMAVDAPPRALMIPLFVVYDALLIAFGVGIWRSAARRSTLRATAGLLLAVGAIGLVAPFFPIHLRGTRATFSDVVHLYLTGLTAFLILLAIGFAALAFGRRFRIYSLLTILVFMLFGGLTSLYAPRFAANLPTPWMGVYERINVYGYLLWVAVLALTLLTAERSRDAASLSRADQE